MRYTFHILAHNNQQSHHVVAVEEEHVDHCEQPRCGYRWCWSSFHPPCWSLMSSLDSRYFIAMNVDDMVITTTRNTTTTTTMTTKIMMMLIPSSLSSWPWEVRITLATTLTTCLPTRNNCSPTRPHSPNTLLVSLWQNHSQPIVFVVKKEKGNKYLAVKNVTPNFDLCTYCLVEGCWSRWWWWWESDGAVERCNLSCSSSYNMAACWPMPRAKGSRQGPSFSIWTSFFSQISKVKRLSNPLWVSRHRQGSISLKSRKPSCPIAKPDQQTLEEIWGGLSKNNRKWIENRH